MIWPWCQINNGWRIDLCLVNRSFALANLMAASIEPSILGSDREICNTWTYSI
jgi:exonuclease III